MHESTDVRLARIEEGLVHIHSKMDAHHITIMETIAPKLASHHDDIRDLKRDRYWTYSLAAVFGGAAGILAKILL